MKRLPGNPDIVLPRHKKIIFVHGCFWHGHICKRGARIPETNQEYWLKKIERNVERDKSYLEQLEDMRWNVLVLWECETKDLEALMTKLETFISPKDRASSTDYTAPATS